MIRPLLLAAVVLVAGCGRDTERPLPSPTTGALRPCRQPADGDPVTVEQLQDSCSQTGRLAWVRWDCRDGSQLWASDPGWVRVVGGSGTFRAGPHDAAWAECLP